MSFFDCLLTFEEELEPVECFKFYDKGGKKYLDSKDFYELMRSLFMSDPSFPAEADAGKVLSSFDMSMDCLITEHDLKIIWYDVIRTLYRPVSALIVVDMQNDFVEGSLAMKKCPSQQDATDVVPFINALVKLVKFDCVVYSMDWHPVDHISFFENRLNYKLCGDPEEYKLFDTVTFQEHGKMEQKLWPVHCVQDTWGAQLHSDLKVPEKAIITRKGLDPTVDSYSAFWDNMKLSSTGLHEELQKRKVTHVFICGVAFDYCVAYTALDAIELGYATVIIEDATCGTDFTSISKMKEKLINSSCVIEKSSQVSKLMLAKDIRYQFAQIFAKNSRKR